jgi:pyridoxal phosphate enzyme (YggS family)
MGFELAMPIEKRRIEILERIKNACLSCGRNENDVSLLAVSKKQPITKIETMVSLGQKSFGENYVQEFLEKKELLKNKNIEWHLIGPLQSNKVTKVIGEVKLIHSVDNLKLAKVISEKAKEKNITQSILLQINTANEASKSGMGLDQSDDFFKEVSTFSNIRIEGLMTMPPLADNAEDSRKYFKILKNLSEKYKLKELSMGTTQDFEVAIQEGATIIRVGEALFGPRTGPHTEPQK